VKKNVLCEKGDEITRFDGTGYLHAYVIGQMSEGNFALQEYRR
jgi:hypothetical protein